ncbi:MAG TPA: SPOR domain-containing protein [Blastocatellia bacterium]|nr:SPOR domain-containing protein [Blastocatellia bacterium]
MRKDATDVLEIGAVPEAVATVPALDEAEHFDPILFFDSNASLPECLEAPEPVSALELSWEVGGGSLDGDHAIHSRDEVTPPLAGLPSAWLHPVDESTAELSESATEFVSDPASQDYQKGELGFRTEHPASTEPAGDSGSSSDESTNREQEIPIHDLDYSKYELPVLIGPDERKSVSRLRAFMVVLTLVISAAAFYFLIYQPMTGGEPKAATITSIPEQSAPVAEVTKPGSSSSATDAQSLAPTRSAETPTAPSSAEQTPEANEATSNTGERGRFSLQAAAFPTRAAADEFAEKLKRTGVPSYVLSADMGKRGTWYRVRVGRFESAEAARSYSSEAQLRAKPAGISLQLIVCQYDQ